MEKDPVYKMLHLSTAAGKLCYQIARFVTIGYCPADLLTDATDAITYLSRLQYEAATEARAYYSAIKYHRYPKGAGQLSYDYEMDIIDRWRYEFKHWQTLARVERRRGNDK